MNIDSSSPTRFLFVAAAFVVVVAGMRAAESLLVPFLLSVFIALICSPPLVWLKRKKVPGGLAIVLIGLGVLAAAVLVGAVVGTSINAFQNDLPEYQAKLQNMSTGLRDWLSQRGLDIDISRLRQSFNPGAAMKLAGNTLASFGNAMTNLFMIILTVVFILAEGAGFGHKLARSRGETGSVDTLKDFAHIVNRYVGIKTLLSLLTGALIAICLWLLGVDYVAMWALLAFLLNFIPTVGSILAAIPVVLLSLVQLGPLSSLLVAIAYLVVNVLVGNVLEPRIMGRGLNLSPLVVFLSLVFWGWVLGPVGMLLSIPLTIVVKIALERDERTRWIGLMLGSP